MADDFVYHTGQDLWSLGEHIRDLAIELHTDEAGIVGEVGAGSPDAARLRTWVAESYSDIPGLFEPFGVPDPRGIQTNVDQLYQVAATLEPDLTIAFTNGSEIQVQPPPAHGSSPAQVNDVVANIENRADGWRGAAAASFKKYVTSIKQASAYQRQVTISLAVALLAQMEIRKRMITNIWDIGNQTYKALDARNATWPSSNDLTVSLTAAGAIGQVLLAVPSDGPSHAAAGMSSAATLLGAANQPAPPTLTIGGDNVADVLNSMRHAIYRLRMLVDSEQRTIVDAVNRIQSDLDAMRSAVQLALPGNMMDLGSATAGELLRPEGFFPS